MGDNDRASDALPRIPGFEPAATPIVSLGLGLAGILLRVRPRLAPLPLALTAAAALLCRDPERATPDDADALFAPADGVAHGTNELYEHRFLHTDAVQLSINVSPFDVAVQRSPASGTIDYLEHYPADLLPLHAAHDVARRTERLFLGISTAWGPLLLVITARIPGQPVTPLVRLGDRVRAGQRLARVRFGSRVDLLAPRDLIEWQPAPGARLRAGVSLIGQVVLL
ncbi:MULTISPECIES: phosphatidylserine decarboxylase [Roseiflexus]|jgi:phosphatidylserine decarboxylase|uniref:Phosphatidylserine decarboxylase-related n=1 Tax=Roseiflexus castenholzii (strain DSM 13941 / HLO8) TaxID=383372 RepID=A7NJT5_ROSCS|nr:MULTISPECIES: phosphatidylserine decarboxylase [Roseiflexus]ABU57755.1 phosphatidylserine decarboxylase-related [Roseiflexus castenholzii DSM 13941]GIW00643.1 MAG: phosphatidylserine decarboxylase [Roseiflexus sp.]